MTHGPLENVIPPASLSWRCTKKSLRVIWHSLPRKPIENQPYLIDCGTLQHVLFHLAVQGAISRLSVLVCCTISTSIRQLSVSGFVRNSNAPLYPRQICSTTLELLLDLCLSMVFQYYKPTVAVTGLHPAKRPAKLSSATGHTATPALFLAYQVFTLDARNCAKKRLKQLTRNNCLRYLIPDMRDPSMGHRHTARR